MLFVLISDPIQKGQLVFLPERNTLIEQARVHRFCFPLSAYKQFWEKSWLSSEEMLLQAPLKMDHFKWRCSATPGIFPIGSAGLSWREDPPVHLQARGKYTSV